MPKRPLVLLHGYSDRGRSYRRWLEILGAEGYQVHEIHTANYETLTNEMTLDDISEGFDRALRLQAGLENDQEFDAVVHSTGMLVLRAWLSRYAPRRSRLKHLIGLAPATFGSPLAHKGRSWLGSIFKGRKELGPDFLEAGDRVLDGLELASAFTWNLAHTDLLCDPPCFGPGAETPFVFVFCGDKSYGGLRKLVSEPGTDGTVRWAGCALDTRKVSLDLTLRPRTSGDPRMRILPEGSRPDADAPLVPVAGANHAEVLRDPPPHLIDMILSALRVASEAGLKQWYDRQDVQAALAHRGRMHRYQQFVVRLLDERGDGVTDYNLELVTRNTAGRTRRLDGFDEAVHVYSRDKSLRSFHVDLDALLPEQLSNLSLRLIASSGSALVGYYAFGGQKVEEEGGKLKLHSAGKWDGLIDISKTVQDSGFRFFYPFTTTLVEITVDREPMPLVGPNKVLWFRD